MVLAHEMGHSFGLSHDPDVVSTVIISVITDYFGLFGLLLLFGVRARLCQRAVARCCLRRVATVQWRALFNYSMLWS